MEWELLSHPVLTPSEVTALLWDCGKSSHYPSDGGIKRKRVLHGVSPAQGVILPHEIPVLIPAAGLLLPLG